MREDDHEHNKDHVSVAMSLATAETSRKGEAVEEAMSARGKATCLEEKAIMERLISEADAHWEGIPSEDRLW